MASVPRDWIVRGRIPPDAAEQIRKAIAEEPDRDPFIQRFIFNDWDALDPAVLTDEEEEWKAFVTVFPDE